MPAISGDEPIKRREARLEVEVILRGNVYEPGDSSLLVTRTDLTGIGTIERSVRQGAFPLTEHPR